MPANVPAYPTFGQAGNLFSQTDQMSQSVLQLQLEFSSCRVQYLAFFPSKICDWNDWHELAIFNYKTIKSTTTNQSTGQEAPQF